MFRTCLLVPLAAILVPMVGVSLATACSPPDWLAQEPRERLSCSGLSACHPDPHWVRTGWSASDQRVSHLLARARLVAVNTQTLEGRCEVWVREQGQATRTTATVRLMRPNYGLVHWFDATGAPILTQACDGQMAFFVTDPERSFWRIPAQRDGGNFVGSAGPGNSPIDAFFFPQHTARGGNTRYRGKQKIDGRIYDVVERRREDDPQAITLYFGRTGLLEGTQTTQRVGSHRQRVTMWWKRLRLNVPMTRDRYRYAPPAGYRVVPAPAPAIGPSLGP
jgi:hypothetical protein